MAYKLQQYSYDWIRDGVTKFLKNDTYFFETWKSVVAYDPGMHSSELTV